MYGGNAESEGPERPGSEAGRVDDGASERPATDAVSDAVSDAVPADSASAATSPADETVVTSWQAPLAATPADTSHGAPAAGDGSVSGAAPASDPNAVTAATPVGAFDAQSTSSASTTSPDAAGTTAPIGPAGPAGAQSYPSGSAGGFGAPQVGAFGQPLPPQQGGWGGGLPPYGMPTPPLPEPSGGRRKKLLLPASVLVAALIGGCIGGLVVHAASGPSTVQSSLASSSSADQAAAPATGNVEQVAKNVQPSVVTLAASDSSGQEVDTGSGIVLSSDGMIVTNNHVVEAAADGGSVEVTTSDGHNYSAKIVGRDQLSDLAVIKAENVNNLKPAVLGNSTTLQVGQQVVAIGAPLDLAGTVTSGIVSALNRPVNTTESEEQEQQELQQQEQGNQDPFGDNSPFGGGQSDTTPQGGQQTVIDAIQTDAAINPGNSGGALIDMDGRVVGINSAIASVDSSGDSQSGSIGVGFAIPISEAKPIIQDLMDGKTVQRAQLDVEVQDETSNSVGGAKVVEVTSGGAADNAGLKVGDVITKVDQRSIQDSDALVAAIRSYQPGNKVTITYVRGDTTHTTTVTLDSSASATGEKS
jgi:putative serine protease PepD